ncbi:MAG: ABC transporter ATP-binding protein [Clostridia bacterium]|nr:ABC transporter ATP-binding protein [Clostridia bacterium]
MSKKEKSKKTSVSSVLKTLKRYYAISKEHFGWGFLRMIGGVCSASLGVFSSYLMGSVADVAISGDLKKFYHFAWLILIFFFSRGIVNFVNPLTGIRYSVYSGRKLRSMTVEKINRLPISYYENKHTGEVVTRLANDVDKLQQFYGNSIAGVWSFMPTMLIVSIWVLLKIDILLTLICCTIIPLVWFLANKIILPIGDASREQQKYVAEYNSYLRDFLEGIHIYISYNMKRLFAAKFNKACNKVYEQSLEISKRRARSTMVNIISYIVPQILAYSIGGVFVARGRLTVGNLIIFASVIVTFLGSVRQLSGTWSDLVLNAGKAEHLFELLDEKSERDDGKDFTDENEKHIISFKDVCYTYKNSNQVFNGISLAVEKSSKVAIVGVSGSGKTTLLKLVLGYYDHYDGNIEFLNHNIRDWNLSALRRNMALVTQEVYLFNDTVMENIRSGNPDADDEMVIEAAKKAYAHEFILELEKGYQTIVGERGGNLSGGQQQRIAIARAILKDAPVLLLDEPTSALDTKAEFYVQKALEKLEEGKTVLVIAHRLSTILNADMIIVLEGGKVIESGTHEQLIERSGKYIELYHQQLVEKEGRNENDEEA